MKEKIYRNIVEHLEDEFNSASPLLFKSRTKKKDEAGVGGRRRRRRRREKNGGRQGGGGGGEEREGDFHK